MPSDCTVQVFAFRLMHNGEKTEQSIEWSHEMVWDIVRTDHLHTAKRWLVSS